MTKKDFFRLIIKLFGLYSLINSLFSVLPGTISTSIYDFGVYGLLFLIIIVLVVVALYIILIRKADTVIEWLELDKGFDSENIDLKNLNSENIAKLGAFIIGGFLLIDNIPTFLSNCYYAFRLDIKGDAFDLLQNLSWTISLLNIMLGYFLVVYHQQIANFLYRNDSKSEVETID